MTSPDVTPPPPAPGPAPSASPAHGAGVRLGLRANLALFCLLVAVNALVGGTLGQERTVVPLLAARTFHLAAFSSALTFIKRGAARSLRSRSCSGCSRLTDGRGMGAGTVRRGNGQVVL